VQEANATVEEGCARSRRGAQPRLARVCEVGDRGPTPRLAFPV
jgi:hypothetical protein